MNQFSLIVSLTRNYTERYDDYNDYNNNNKKYLRVHRNNKVVTLIYYFI